MTIIHTTREELSAMSQFHDGSIIIQSIEIAGQIFSNASQFHDGSIIMITKDGENKHFKYGLNSTMVRLLLTPEQSKYGCVFMRSQFHDGSIIINRFYDGRYFCFECLNSTMVRLLYSTERRNEQRTSDSLNSTMVRLLFTC